jgi:hypothetical protein
LSPVPVIAAGAATPAAATPATPALIWRLPKRINLPLDEIAIVFAIGVITAQLQRCVICLESVRPSL